jgi:hypothetical protein
VLLLVVPAAAHHFVPRESDTPVSISGVVAKFQMINPHSRLFLEVLDPSGVFSIWEIELGSVAALMARGWTRDLLKPGDPVTVQAILWKGRAHAAVARDVELPDGRRLFGGSHAGDYAARR